MGNIEGGNKDEAINPNLVQKEKLGNNDLSQALNGKGLTPEGEKQIGESLQRVGKDINSLCTNESFSNCNNNLGDYISDMSYSVMIQENPDFKIMGENVPEFKDGFKEIMANNFSRKNSLINYVTSDIASKLPDDIKKEIEAYTEGGKKGKLSKEAQKAYSEAGKSISIAISKIDLQLAAEGDQKLNSLYTKLLPIMKERFKNTNFQGGDDSVIIIN